MSEEQFNITVDADHIYQLRRFRYDNSPHYGPSQVPVRDAPATDQEIRDLLIFGARLAGPNLGLPLHLEAHRVIRLVPEDLGAKLFENQP